MRAYDGDVPRSWIWVVFWNVLLDCKVEDFFLGARRRTGIFADVLTRYAVFDDIEGRHGG